MQVIRVEGGHNLVGTVWVEGAKNSVLKLLAASVMAPGIYTISRVPHISDVQIMSRVLEVLGAHVTRSDHKLVLDTTRIDKCETPYELVSKMRASISVLGPLISRFGQAHVSMPGGCQIGARKLDLHFTSLQALGVHFEFEHGVVHASTPHGLHGATVTLEFPSVGATENLMMAAVCATGTTTIDNAAREPEIVDLALMLNNMGARVSGAGSPIIEIEGVPQNSLHATDHSTVGDRIEAGTFLVAGALCKGPVSVRGFDPAHVAMVINKLKAMGATVELLEDGATISCDKPLSAIDIQTLPYPGFPTDMQAQLMVLAALAKGNSIITENVFENRFMFAGELVRMGAEIRIEGHHALVQGVKRLSGAQVASTDLRGGAALVLAGLAADGETLVSGIEHIRRGYENYVEKLASLGASLEIIEVTSELEH